MAFNYNKIQSYNKYFKWRDSKETSKNGKPNLMFKIFSFIFTPYFFLKERKILNYFWYIIQEELGNNAELVSYLDKNEFGIGKYKIYKKDVIIPNSDLDVFKPQQLEQMISKEYSTYILKLIHDSSSFNVEDYIGFAVKCYLHRQPNTEHILKIYEIELSFFRYPFYVKARKYFMWWLITFFVLLLVGTAIYFLINK